MISRLLSHHASKSVDVSDLWVVPRKKGYIRVSLMYVFKKMSFFDKIKDVTIVDMLK